MLNILAEDDLSHLPQGIEKHLVIEAMRRAYRDRAEYLGDPDFVEVPVARLTHPFYAAGQRASIRLDRATPSATLPSYMEEREEGRHTTHFSVLDADGNRVAGTQTINSWFGSAFMVPGTGVLLNNEMDDFSIKPGVENIYRLVGAAANEIAPGKRPLSSMTPTFVESDRGIMILGTPGGSRIITMVLLGILEWLDGANAAGVASLPRYHHQFLPDQITYEPEAISAAEAAALKAKGHELQPSTRLYGNMNVVTRDNGTGRAAAAADPRAQGAAAWETDEGTRFVETDPDASGGVEVRVY
jgi:gamma-glutamyltranspeptidase/glutathione hydrolase